MPEKSVNPDGRLRGQMFLALLCFGLVPLLASGVAGYVAYRGAIEKQSRNVLEAMMKNRKETVELFLEEKMRQLEFVAVSYSAAQLAKPELLGSLLGQLRQNRGAFIDLGLIDENGHHTAYAGPYKLQNMDYSEQPWFQRVMVLGRFESDIFLGLRRFPHMVMAVKKREAGRDWIVRATIDTDILDALVRGGSSESGSVFFILNRAGEYQTRYSDRYRLMEKADIDTIPLHSGVRVVTEERNGIRGLLATGWLRGDSWVLVARQQMPGPSLLFPEYRAVVTVLAVGFVTIPVLSYVIARRRLRQFKALEAERGSLYESIAQSQKMAAIGRLASGVAHEVNNPLAIIQAQVGVLADLVNENPDFPRAAEFKDRVTKIDAQVQRGRKVIHHLLGFSHRVGPELEPVNVISALEETIGLVEKELEITRIRIQREYSPDVPIVRSSLAQMQQVFLNLINNALDAIGEDGELRLSVERSGEGVAVRVADTGPGILERDLARIFEPFFSTKSVDGRHTGLGLAICREIMRGLEGRIGVESIAGKGTTFSLWFPLKAEAG
jgi:two-component system NtrC family sensor kinase